MSGYNGRCGPNVSQYVANLNTIVPEQVHDPSADLDGFDMFLNAGMFNEYDTSNVELDPALNVDFEAPPSTTDAAHQLPGASATDAKIDFPLDDNFSFDDFTYTQPLPIVQNPLPAYPAVGATYTSPASALSPVTPGFDATAAGGKKRKASDATDLAPASDEHARHAAEEDKRRRNTAASARFRIKKKQREQALEASAKEMKERVNLLEARVQQLETENTWLKGLITEKNGGKASPKEIQARLERREESERSSGGRTDGVGTASA